MKPPTPQVDVVVIGGGLAGHCAALKAAELGASVALFEKTLCHGGSSIQSGGSFAFSNTEDQRAVGITDSDELFELDLIRASDNKADLAQVKLYLAHQHETRAWLKAQGVEFHKVSLSSNTSVPRTHPTNPRQCMNVLNQRVQENPRVAYHADTAVNRLITCEGRNRVLGVEVTRAGEHSTVRARGGVIIASGGFTKSPNLMEKFAPELLSAPTWGGAGNTGDGLLMGWELGADLVDMGYMTGTFGMSLNRYPDLSVRPEDEPLLRMAIYRGAIVVNLDGKRYADESISYKTLGTLTLAQPKGVAFQIFDQPIMDQSVPEPTVNDFEGALERGVIKQAESLREVAYTVGLDPDAVEATVARYNCDIGDTGRDQQFGRENLGKNWGKLVKIEKPSFYILPSSTGVLSTYCGLHVDTRMRVLNVHGRVIRGLFAAGEVTGGFHGGGYVSGTAQGKAAIFGRIAGAAAATVSTQGILSETSSDIDNRTG